MATDIKSSSSKKSWRDPSVTDPIVVTIWEHLYGLGKNKLVDISQALKAIEKGVAKNIPLAYVYKGYVNHHGWGVERNRAEALKCFVKGGNHPFAIFYVAEWFRFLSNQPEIYQVLHWIAFKGIVQLTNTVPDHPIAWHLRGTCVWSGDGTPKHEVAAYNIWLQHKSLGHVITSYSLAREILTETTSVSSLMPFPGAIKLMKEAAERHFPDACYFMGWVYEHGPGTCSIDLKEAHKWYRRGAELQDADCMAVLGQHAWSGTGMPKNQTEAVRTYLRAAVCSDDACLRVGNWAYWGQLRQHLPSGFYPTGPGREAIPSISRLESKARPPPLFGECDRRLALAYYQQVASEREGDGCRRLACMLAEFEALGQDPGPIPSRLDFTRVAVECKEQVFTLLGVTPQQIDEAKTAGGEERTGNGAPGVIDLLSVEDLLKMEDEEEEAGLKHYIRGLRAETRGQWALALEHYKQGGHLGDFQSFYRMSLLARGWVDELSPIVDDPSKGFAAKVVARSSSTSTSSSTADGQPQQQQQQQPIHAITLESHQHRGPRLNLEDRFDHFRQAFENAERAGVHHHRAIVMHTRAVLAGGFERFAELPACLPLLAKITDRFPIAQYYSALVLQRTDAGAGKELEQAAQCLRKLTAEHRFPPALTLLADVLIQLRKRTGLTTHVSEAVKALNSAAELGDLEAAQRLSLAYLHGYPELSLVPKPVAVVDALDRAVRLGARWLSLEWAQERWKVAPAAIRNLTSSSSQQDKAASLSLRRLIRQQLFDSLKKSPIEPGTQRWYPQADPQMYAALAMQWVRENLSLAEAEGQEEGEDGQDWKDMEERMGCVQQVRLI